MKKLILIVFSLFIITFSWGQSTSTTEKSYSIANVIAEHSEAEIKKDEENKLIFVMILPKEGDELLRTLIYNMNYHSAPIAVQSWLDISQYPILLQELKDDEDLIEIEPGVFLNKERNITYYISTEEIYCILMVARNDL